MKTNTWICSLCTDEEGMPKEFKTDKEYSDHNRKYHSGETLLKEEIAKNEEVSNVVEVKKQPLQGIVLSYKFIGDCPNCGCKEVDTLEIKVYNRFVVVGYCPHEKKQIVQQEVIPINQQSQWLEEKEGFQKKQKKG